MISMLQNWKGSLEVNGKQFDSIESFNASNLSLSGAVSIKLYPIGYKPHIDENTKPEQHATENHSTAELGSEEEFVITVKKYMTQKAVPGFDFMATYNNNNPMPLRTMVGTKIKETRGMVYMKLHGDILAETVCTCMKCGKKLTNPVSQYFGIGPECGGHNYVHPFDTDEELHAAVDQYRVKLQNITWEGWIIKSAITSEERR